MNYVILYELIQFEGFRTKHNQTGSCTVLIAGKKSFDYGAKIQLIWETSTYKAKGNLTSRTHNLLKSFGFAHDPELPFYG